MKLNSILYVFLSVAFLASATEGGTIRGGTLTVSSNDDVGRYLNGGDDNRKLKREDEEDVTTSPTERSRPNPTGNPSYYPTGNPSSSPIVAVPHPTEDEENKKDEESSTPRPTGTPTTSPTVAGLTNTNPFRITGADDGSD